MGRADGFDEAWRSLNLDGEDASRNGNAEKERERNNALLAGRVLLAKAIQEGVEPPAELEKAVLLAGRVHSFYGPSGSGKTWLMLWLMKRCIERGERVVVLDMENGKRIVSERLEQLGVDPERVDDLLYYIPSPSMSLGAEDRLGYEAMLDEVKPALVIFDSLINFLASCGLEENSNDDVARWAFAFCHPPRNRGITVALLDHIPKEGMSARGAGRKKDEVDVMWRVQQTKPFDRDSVGEIILVREKDREGWLPPSVKFTIGGGSEGFVFARSEGTLHDPGSLPDKQRQALTALTTFGVGGARYKEWKDASGLPSSTFDRTKAELVRSGVARHEEGRYFAPENPEKRGGGSSGGSGLEAKTPTPTRPPHDPQGEFGLYIVDSPHNPQTPNQPPNGSGGSGEDNPHNPRGSVRPRGGGSPGGEDTGCEDEHDRKALDALMHGNGPRKALLSFKEDGTPFEYVIRSVMHYWNRRKDPVDDWEAAVIHAVGTLDRGGAS